MESRSSRSLHWMGLRNAHRESSSGRQQCSFPDSSLGNLQEPCFSNPVCGGKAVTSGLGEALRVRTCSSGDVRAPRPLPGYVLSGSQLGPCRRNAGTREARSPASPFPPRKGCLRLSPTPRLSPATLLVFHVSLSEEERLHDLQGQDKKRRSGGKPCWKPSRTACRCSC